jgi:hypothetical protein
VLEAFKNREAERDATADYHQRAPTSEVLDIGEDPIRVGLLEI